MGCTSHSTATDRTSDVLETIVLPDTSTTGSPVSPLMAAFTTEPWGRVMAVGYAVDTAAAGRLLNGLKATVAVSYPVRLML